MVADMKTMIDLPGMKRNLSLSNCFYQNWTIIFREGLLHQKQDQKSSYQKQVVSAPQLASSMINVRRELVSLSAHSTCNCTQYSAAAAISNSRSWSPNTIIANHILIQTIILVACRKFLSYSRKPHAFCLNLSDFTSWFFLN